MVVTIATKQYTILNDIRNKKIFVREILIKNASYSTIPRFILYSTINTRTRDI